MKLTLGFIVVASLASAANAGVGLSITVNTNSTGRVAITSFGGAGSQANPIVINENWFGSDLEATIDISGAAAQSGLGINPAAAGSFGWGIFVQKRVTNNSGQVWNFFDNELQEVLGTPSSNGDGLSFGQSLASVRPFTSNLLPTVTEIIDPRDYVNFSGGSVPVGGTLIMNFLITDTSPVATFHLRQRPNFIPTPGIGASLLLGGTLVARRRRR